MIGQVEQHLSEDEGVQNLRLFLILEMEHICKLFFSKLVKFIATDMQPIQVVENEGTRFKNYKIEKDELRVELSNFSLCDMLSLTRYPLDQCKMIFIVEFRI